MNRQKKVISIVLATMSVITLLSCNSEKRINRNFNYFQHGLDSIQSKVFNEPKLKINDMIKVAVVAGSIRQEDAALFNVSSQPGAAGYLIDSQGNIEMPKIGKVKAVDMLPSQLADTIKTLLAKEVKNPVVTVTKDVKLKVNVLGEVRKPGSEIFFKDKVNLIDAIAEAGDLTDNGKREDILLMRKVDDKYETYKLDLRNTSFINSPAFYLQDNDVIYVGANRAKLLTVGRDPNSERSFQLALQVISTISVVLNTIIILKRL